MNARQFPIGAIGFREPDREVLRHSLNVLTNIASGDDGMNVDISGSKRIFPVLTRKGVHNDSGWQEIHDVFPLREVNTSVNFAGREGIELLKIRLSDDLPCLCDGPSMREGDHFPFPNNDGIEEIIMILNTTTGD